MMKNKVYDLSLEKLKFHDEVALYLGTSIEPGFFVTGQAGSTETELNYSISGTLDSAEVYVYAEVKNGTWVIHELFVTVDGINKKIDALDLP